MVKNILSNLKFKCKNGCDIQIPYNDLREHYEEKCPKLILNQNTNHFYLNLINCKLNLIH